MPRTVSDFPVKSAPLPGSEGCVLTLLPAALEVGKVMENAYGADGNTHCIARLLV